MGLDNGFRVKGLKRSDIPSFVKITSYSNDEVELVYWRKCWGLRAAVFRALHGKSNEYEIKVEAEDIPAIIREIKPFFDAKTWEEESDSIWEFDEMFDNLFQSVINLMWLETYLRENPDVECCFYDSY